MNLRTRLVTMAAAIAAVLSSAVPAHASTVPHREHCRGTLDTIEPGLMTFHG